MRAVKSNLNVCGEEPLCTFSTQARFSIYVALNMLAYCHKANTAVPQKPNPISYQLASALISPLGYLPAATNP